jgi:hypothetical protein
MDATTTTFSFGFALFLAVGTLAFYLLGALWIRLARQSDSNPLYTFNLGAPSSDDREQLFAVALVAAGTSLSTVFLFFLTAGSKYGWWIALCPVLFAGGNYLMFVVYGKIVRLGYFDEDPAAVLGAAGLIPYLGQRLTGSRLIAFVLLLVSLANLLAVLVLELTVGADVLIYLTGGLSNTLPSATLQLSVFAVTLGLLLGYVFVGGFAAVLASDLWQLKIISWAILATLLSLLVFGISSHIEHRVIDAFTGHADTVTLLSFLGGVVAANLLVPLSQESSWQRFRAFTHLHEFSIQKALSMSVWKSTVLWFGLLLLAVGLRLVGTTGASEFGSMHAVLEAFRVLNDWWFPMAVFPVLTIAALSAMYSTADTCVSAILYLIDYAWASRGGRAQVDHGDGKLPAAHYWAMGALFLFCMAVYAVVRFWFHPTMLQLVFSVFSNLIVIAPTIVLASRLPPLPAGQSSPRRARAVFGSLLLGSGTFWALAGFAIAKGSEYEWLSQVAIVPALFGAALPLLFLSFNPGGHAQRVPSSLS